MWRIIAAKQAGTSHLAQSLDCQDCYRVETLTADSGEQVLVAIAADGAGSAKHGQTGAEQTCIVLAELVSAAIRSTPADLYSESRAREWLHRLRLHLEDIARDAGLHVRDYATTLLMAIVGQQQSLFLQIGDGAMVTTIHGEQKVVFWPESGLYANMTHFVTDEDVFEHMMIALQAGTIEELAVFTDGLQRLALQMDARTAHAPFFEPIFAALRRLEAGANAAMSQQLALFLSSPQVNQRTDDDKTLIMATRRR